MNFYIVFVLEGGIEPKEMVDKVNNLIASSAVFYFMIITITITIING